MRILVDKITSSVSALNEVAIQKAVSNLAKGRIVLVIAPNILWRAYRSSIRKHLQY